MFDERTLENGLRIIGERIEHFRSVTLGVWLGVGSQHETREESGLSHFLEHMLFKGTQKRTAMQIAQEMDGVGGQLNAFTSKECTCYYAKVMDEHTALAVDMLGDMVRSASLDPKELEKEKGVIIEEISMVEDSPEDVAHELLSAAWFGDGPLARPILGTADKIAAYSREDIFGYRRRMYRPDNAVIAIAGNYDWDEVVGLLEAQFGDWARGEGDLPGWPGGQPHGQLRIREKDIEQIHLCLAFPGIAQKSDDVYPLSVFNNLFGGAMSSRLFQKIREEKGMAYTVYSYPTTYVNCGAFSVYAGTSPKHAQNVLEMIDQEIDRLLLKGIEQTEFSQAREQLKGGYILGLESASSRMNSLGRRKLLFGDIRTEDEVIAKINAVTMEDVERVVRGLFGGKRSAAMVGKDVGKLDASMFVRP